MNVALVGYRGCGKSTLGKRLADKLWEKFIDIDDVIVRKEGSRSVAVWGYPLTPVIYIAATLVLAAMAGSREPMQFAAAIITIVSGSVVYYAFGLHKVSPPPSSAGG
jgi:cation transporter-like permease